MFEFVPHEAAPAAVKEHHSALVVSWIPQMFCNGDFVANQTSAPENHSLGFSFPLRSGFRQTAGCNPIFHSQTELWSEEISPFK